MFESDDGLQIGMGIDNADMAEFLHDNFRVAMSDLRLALAKAISQVRRTELLLDSVVGMPGDDEEEDEFNEGVMIQIRIALAHMNAFNRNLVVLEYEGLEKS